MPSRLRGVRVSCSVSGGPGQRVPSRNGTKPVALRLGPCADLFFCQCSSHGRHTVRRQWHWCPAEHAAGCLALVLLDHPDTAALHHADQALVTQHADGLPGGDRDTPNSSCMSRSLGSLAVMTPDAMRSRRMAASWTYGGSGSSGSIMKRSVSDQGEGNCSARLGRTTLPARSRVACLARPDRGHLDVDGLLVVLDHPGNRVPAENLIHAGWSR